MKSSGGIIKKAEVSGVVKYALGTISELDENENIESLLNIERQEAYLKGSEEGEKNGYLKAQKEALTYISLLQKVTAMILEQKKRLLEHLRPEIVEFSLAVCERILRQELSQPEKLVRMIDSLLSSATGTLQGDVVKILLSPDDLILIEKHLNQIHYDKREIKSVRFIADPLIRRGDCRIETKTGLLNCTLSRELEDLRSKVLRPES